MFLSKLETSGTAVFAAGAAFLLSLATLGFAQEKPESASSTAKVSTRTKSILAKLEQRVSMDFADETPLDDVLKYIRQATIKGQNDPELPIYIDPVGLREANRSLKSTVKLKVENSPLKVTLPQILKQLDLAHVVKDDVLIISSRKGIYLEKKESSILAKDASPKTKAVLETLDWPIAMSFGDETPLDDVLKYVTQATTTPTFAGIPIVVDPLGLKQVNRSLTSSVLIDLEGVPLKTTIRLMLKQLDLGYIIEDGKLLISSSRRIQERAGRPGGDSKGDGDERK
jgi:hypothetical protein